MILTEEEAKNKLCPEAIGVGDINWVMVPSGRMCIGSDCMAWRWHDPIYVDGVNLRDPPRGFCGKAGKP